LNFEVIEEGASKLKLGNEIYFAIELRNNELTDYEAKSYSVRIEFLLFLLDSSEQLK